MMLCRDFGEALNLLIGIVIITVGLGVVTIASHLGLIQWQCFEPSLVWGVWLGSLALGLLALIFGAMR